MTMSLEATVNAGQRLRDLLARRRAVMAGRSKGAPMRRPPRQLLPDTEQREYTKGLNRIVDALRLSVDAVIIPALPRLVDEADRHKPEAAKARADSYFDLLAQVVRTARAHYFGLIPPDDAAALARAVGSGVARFNAKQVAKVFKAGMGLDLFQSEPWLNEAIGGFVTGNVALIKSIEDRYFGDIEQIVHAGASSGLRHEALAAQIGARYDVTKSRAAFIARDQTAKFNGNLTQLRQTNAGVSRYVWRTAGDERVRASHRAHNGKTFSWDDPPAETGHPGHDFNCRCYAEPVLKDLLKDGEDR